MLGAIPADTGFQKNDSLHDIGSCARHKQCGVATHRLADKGNGSPQNRLDHEHHAGYMGLPRNVIRESRAPSVPSSVNRDHSVIPQGRCCLGHLGATARKAMKDHDRRPGVGGVGDVEVDGATRNGHFCGFHMSSLVGTPRPRVLRSGARADACDHHPTVPGERQRTRGVAAGVESDGVEHVKLVGVLPQPTPGDHDDGDLAARYRYE